MTLWLLALLALASSTGCAIIGAGVGSLIPKYEPLSSDPLVEQAETGQQIHVVRASDGEELSGRYGGVYDEQLWVRTPDGAIAVPTRDVKSARVGPTPIRSRHATTAHFASDNHWLEGFFVGLALDVATIAIVGSNIHYLFPETTRSFHVGADGVSVDGR